MKLRVWAIIAASVLSVVLLLAIGLFALLNSQAGSRWLLRQGFAYLPAEVTAETIEGRLTDRLILTGFDYKSDSAHVAVDRFVFAWDPAQLFRGTVDIDEITADTVDITLTPAEEPAEKPPFDPKNLPRLPIDLVIDRARVTDLTFRQGETVQRIEELQFSAATENDRLKIPELTLKTDSASLTAQGEVTLRGPFAFNAQADLRAATEQYGAWQAQARIRGDMQQIALAGNIASPFGLELKGTVNNWAKTPKLNLHAEWQKLSWPFTGKPPQWASDRGQGEITGPLDDYRIALNGELNPPALPKAMLTLNGKGSQDALAIESLELKSPDGVFRVRGNVSWQPATAFDLALTAKDFNPAVLSPELPGKLSMEMHAEGKLIGDKLQLDARIDQLSGSLRGRPLRGGGQLALADDILKVDSLHLASGVNKIALQGIFGAKGKTLAIEIDTPNLQSLWPTLGGSFQGDGEMGGTWRQPSLSLQGKGKALRFAENRVERLAVDIDYKPEPEKTSKIAVSARSVKSGGLEIGKLSLDGSGSVRQHHFEAHLDSARAQLAAVLDGRLQDGQWNGRLTRLDIRRPSDAAHWQLENPWKIRAQKKPEGIEWNLDSGCLKGEKSSLCLAGHYAANGDFKGEAHIADFPLGLFQDYFPEGLELDGLIDADVDLRRQKNKLTGQYAVSLPGRIRLRLPAPQKSEAIALGPGSLTGELRGEEITANVDLNLAGQDTLRARLRLNTGEPQTVSGRINASLRRLDLIKPFVPQISEIKGHLRADLELDGPLQKPNISGTLAVSEGVLEMADLGLGLRQINIQAVASGERETRVRVDGTTELVLLASQGVAGRKPVREQIRLEADVRFGDEAIAADAKLALGPQNRADAAVRMDTGQRKEISGRLSATLTDWTLLSTLTAPQLSNIRGRLSADIGIRGTRDSPVVDGSLKLAGGAVDLETLGASIRAIELQAMATGNPDKPIRIAGSAKSGQGGIYLNGFADLAGNAGIQLTGNNFEVAKLPEAQVAVTPDLLLQMTPGRRNITGTLKIPKAAIALKELPANAVKVSEDEVILGEEKKQETPPPIPLDANIEVALGNNVSFSGFGLQTDLAGKLTVQKTGGKTTAHGDINVIKGSYEGYGQELTIARGKIIFNGPLDNPWLDITATRESKDQKVTAMLNLSGPLNSPQTRLTSDPPLPESDILAYLVTGGPLEQVSQDEGNLIAGAAAALGSSQVAWIADKFGLDELEIKQGKTLQDTLVQVGQYLSPNFYVGAKVGLFNNQAALVIKRKLTENLNLETEAGTSQRIKLNYEFDTD
jgi:autotransporter translocation and assembly factor TamB